MSQPALIRRLRQRRHWDRAGLLLWSGLIVVLSLLFVSRQRGELLRIATVLRRADPLWTLVSVLVALGILGLFALSYQPLVRRLGYRVGLHTLLDAHLQRTVVATVTPAGGPASIYAFVRYLSRRKVATDDAVLVTGLHALLGYASFTLLLVPVTGLLFVEGRLSSLVLLGSLLVLLIGLALAGLLTIALRPAGPPARLARRLPQRAVSFTDQVRGHGVRPGDLVAPFAVALAVDVANIALLYTALRAIGQQPTLLAPLIGYQVGILFALVAPVFQGIGPVELAMAVALQQCGIPSAAAISATLLFRLLELWLPFVLGLSIQTGQRPELRRASAHLPALVTLATGLLTVFSVLEPSLPRRFNRMHLYSLFDRSDFSRTFVLVAGFFLIFLSLSLWRRKRIAWLAAVVLLAGVIPTHVAKRHDEIVALVAAANLVLLLVHRERFRVRSDLPTVRLGLIRFLLSVVFAILYGVVGFWLLDRREFGIDFSLGAAIDQTFRVFFALGHSGLTPRTRYAHWFLDSLTVVGVVSVAYALFSLARPVIWRRRTLPAERRQARTLAARFGDSSLDYFKTYPDKVYFFSRGGRGFVAYRLALATAVVLGDPVAGSPAEREAVTREFLDFCDANDWRVAFHQVPESELALYRSLGLSALKLGEEAVIDLERFSLRGSAMKALRANVNRAEREGLRAVYYPAPLDRALVARLREVSDEWLTSLGRRERTFTQGQFDDDYVASTPVMTVEDAAGRIVAFANIVPSGVPGQATIDLMRRRAEPKGVMDFLQVRLLEHFTALGYRSFSLGMAPFAEVGTDPAATVPERARLFYERFNRVFSYKGLRDYKDKFQPSWEPRYLVYQSELTLPWVGLALVRVTEAEDGVDVERDWFVPAPEPSTAPARSPRPPLPPRGVRRRGERSDARRGLA